MMFEMIDVAGLAELHERTMRAAAYITKKARERERRTMKMAQIKAWVVAGLVVNVIALSLLLGW